MKNQAANRSLWKTVTVTVVTLLVLAATGSAPPPDNDFLFKVNKSIDLFGRVYKEVATNYVDVVDPEKFMEAGIDGMLGTLDPYTVYIGKEEGDEVDLMTTGKYGGIGVTIGVRDGGIRVINVMDGYSAQRAGILPGDRLIQVDTLVVGNRKADEVRNLTRGEPGTEVRVVIEREGESRPLEFVLIREEIQVKNVTYFSLLDGGIGYIRLERFSRNAGEELRQALKDLKLQGELKGVVLDLRGNPGGLLDAAVDVASKFVPRGSLIVTTRGRRSEAEKKYLSAEEPVVPSAPLAVLTDRASASASEIVAGSLQDLDRAIIVGTRTFGKGLVQTIVPLSFGSQLKITTARYYTPSGRSIQEVNYLHKEKGGVLAVMPDSLKKRFSTAHGRGVYEAGGITPDSTVQDQDVGPMVRELQRRALFFKFANAYVRAHKEPPVAGVTEEILQDFRKFLDQEKFDFREETETKIQDLRTLAGQLHYSNDVLADLDLTVAALEKEKKRAFDRYRDHIAPVLAVELAARQKGEQGRIAESLKDDVQLRVAVGMVKNTKLYLGKLGQ
jgi:carboxyl-terminal processing protease